VRTSVNKNENRVAIDCLDGLIDFESMSMLRNDLLQYDIVLDAKYHEPKMICGVEELFAPIQVFISSDVLQSIVLNLASSAIYDGLRTLLIFLNSQLKDKRINKIQNKRITSIAPNVLLRSNNLRVSIPVSIEQEK